MKMAVIFVCVLLLLGGVFWFVDDFFAPLFLNCRIERLHETGLPKVVVEKGGKIYCRMKADDFSFPLPPGSHALSPTVTSGSFDWVDGTVEARFDSNNQMGPSEYMEWVSGRIQVGGYVTADSVPGGLLITFHYFGDK